MAEMLKEGRHGTAIWSFNKATYNHAEMEQLI